MADTIISNTPSLRDDGGMGGWVVTLAIILAVAIGGFFMYQNGFLNSASDTNDTTNINVTTPDPITPPVTPPVTAE